MAYIGASAIAAAVCGWYFIGWAKLLLAAALCIMTAAVLAACVFKKMSVRSGVTALICLAAAVTVILRAYCYFDIKYLGSESLCGTGHDFYIVIDERLPSGSFGARYNVSVISIDGSDPGGTRARLECDYPAYFRPGDRVSLRAEVVPFEKSALYDGERAALADGITLDLCSGAAEDVLGCDTSSPRFIDKLRLMSGRLALRLSDSVGGEEGALAAAMLFGDRTGLSDATARDFSRAGLSHLLALSGLHLSVIAGVAGWTLHKLRLPKIAKTPLMAAFLFIYLAMTGSHISTVRAAIMQFAVFAAYFSGADGDGVSSVFLAALLILTASPWAVVDVGFILSFAATLGITVFLPSFNKSAARKSGARRKAVGIFYKVAALLLTGLAANCFTVPIIWWIFGEISIAAPVSNLLITPLSAPFLVFSLICLALAGVPFFGSAAAVPVRLTARIMLSFCSAASDLHGAVVSLKYRFVPFILIPAMVVTVVLLAIRTEHRYVCFLPSAAAAAAFCVCFFAFNAAMTDAGISFVSTGGSDALVVTSGIGAAVIDIGSGSYDVLRSASLAAAEEGAVEIDVLILTHYHKYHIASAERFFGREKVRRVWLPYPATADEAEILAHIF